MVVMERIYLLVGTNIGVLEKNLERALTLLQARSVEIMKKSRIYRTKPWGEVRQPDFLNMALEVRTDLGARELLRTIKEIEREMGRQDTAGRWQSRIIDIDILFMDDLVIDQADLKIPHEEFFNRPFAVRILSEIAPGFRPPGADRALCEYARQGSDEGIEVYSD